MNKYTRKQINKNALLHDKEFVTVEDAQTALMNVAAAAVNAGANEEELLAHLDKGKDNE